MRYYVVYDFANDHVLCYEETGKFIIYEEFTDALKNTYANEIAINISELPKGLRNEVIEQISAETKRPKVLRRLYKLWTSHVLRREWL